MRGHCASRCSRNGWRDFATTLPFDRKYFRLLPHQMTPFCFYVKIPKYVLNNSTFCSILYILYQP
jgi:hypothetical protein